MSSREQSNLPDSTSDELQLSHPSEEECNTIWTRTAASWRDALSVSIYLKESLYLTTVPLARGGGMTTWVLVDKSLPPGERVVLCSCESYIKRSISSDRSGNLTETVVHGIASVFCPEDLRHRGYAARMMKELAKIFVTWNVPLGRKCIGSLLYSDIGKDYYAKLGWRPAPINCHVVIKATDDSIVEPSEEISKIDLASLCERDEAMIRKSLRIPAEETKSRFTVIPDLDHMLWHISKEEFCCETLFGKEAPVKGAIAGASGNQVWAIWVRRYYDALDSESPDNVLYILRLVVPGVSPEVGEGEGPRDHIKQVSNLKAVIQAAQKEAFEWKLPEVHLLNPTPAVQKMLKETEIEFELAERDELNIASGMWYDEHGKEGETPEWLNGEYYSWC